MSFSITLRKVEATETEPATYEVASVSAADNGPDEITVYGHTYQGAGSAADALQVRDSRGYHVSMGAPYPQP